MGARPHSPADSSETLGCCSSTVDAHVFPACQQKSAGGTRQTSGYGTGLQLPDQRQDAELESNDQSTRAGVARSAQREGPG